MEDSDSRILQSYETFAFEDSASSRLVATRLDMTVRVQAPLLVSAVVVTSGPCVQAKLTLAETVALTSEDEACASHVTRL